jgi:hypothetical protein
MSWWLHRCALLLMAACANQESRTASEHGGLSSTQDAAARAPAGDNPVAPGNTNTALATAVDGGAAWFQACVTTGTIEASLRPANLLFLIDRSASMNCNLPPITDSAACEGNPLKVDMTQPSKWEIVRNALKQAIAQLPGTSRVGITYFSDDDRCGVQSKPDVPLRWLDANQLSSLDTSLDAVTPRGGTPIVGGLILAYKHLNPDQNPEVPNGNRFVVLLTDGQEGCATDQTPRLLQTELAKARAAAITTFVIGVPGSEVNRSFLSELAFAGGTPSRPDCAHGGTDASKGDCHLDMTQDVDLGAGLSRALAAVSGQALSCEFDVPKPSNGGELDYDSVNVVYADQGGGPEQVIGKAASSPCAQANGWQYNADKSKIVLCGSACNTVRRAANIQIALGCKTVTLL